MLKKLKLSKKRKQLVIALFLLIIIVGFVLLRSKSNIFKPLTVSQMYQNELDALSNDLTELDTYITEKHEINSDLQEYISGINNLKTTCRQMNIYESRYRNTDLSNRTKDNMSNVRSLCTDFLDVLDYSQAQFGALRPYLTIRTAKWPYAVSDEYTGHMNTVNQTIETTLTNLKNVKNTVQDPAIPELTAQLELAQSKLKKAQEAKGRGDNTAADKFTDELIALIDQDKVDFINARTYFWRNTAKLDALRNSVNNLNTNFNQQ